MLHIGICRSWISEGQNHCKRGAHAQSTLAFDEATLGLGDGLRDGQAKASAMSFVAAGRGSTVEAFKYEPEMLGRDSNTLILEARPDEMVLLNT